MTFVEKVSMINANSKCTMASVERMAAVAAGWNSISGYVHDDVLGAGSRDRSRDLIVGLGVNKYKHIQIDILDG